MVELWRDAHAELDDVFQEDEEAILRNGYRGDRNVVLNNVADMEEFSLQY